MEYAVQIVFGAACGVLVGVLSGSPIAAGLAGFLGSMALAPWVLKSRMR